MTSEDALTLLASRKMIDELHHLCRTPLFFRDDGIRDDGWNCRTQAYLLGLVLVGMHISVPVAVGHGRAAFIQGPIQQANPVGLEVNPHGWLMIEKLGVLDLSPTFDALPPPLAGLRSWSSATVLKNQLIPAGTFKLVRTHKDYQREVALATHAENRRTAIYQLIAIDEICIEAMQRGFKIASSPLTDSLAKRGWSQEILLTAARHLYDYANGDTQSLREKSQQKAWKHLSRSKKDGPGWFSSRMKSATELPSAGTV